MGEYVDVLPDYANLSDQGLAALARYRFQEVENYGLDSERLCVLLARRLDERNEEIRRLEGHAGRR